MKHQLSTITTTTSLLNNEPMLSNANNNTTTLIIVGCAFIVLLAIVLVLVIYIFIQSRRRRTVTKSPGKSSGNLRTTLIQSNDTSQLRNNKDGDVNARNCCSKHDSLKSNGIDNNQDELLLNRPISIYLSIGINVRFAAMMADVGDGRQVWTPGTTRVR